MPKRLCWWRVAKRLDLVYDGGSIGLMGLVAEAVHSGVGHVLGIISRPLIGKEKTGETVGELKVLGDMHQRKAEMARHSDCFIALTAERRIKNNLKFWNKKFRLLE